MDTVGAWLVYRTVRDRKAKVVGAVEGRAGAARRGRRISTSRRRFTRKAHAALERYSIELGEWVVETGHTLVGLLGFFGATLIAYANVIRRPSEVPLQCGGRSGSTSSAFGRSGSSA